MNPIQPTILVIDDVYGRTHLPRNRARGDFCFPLGLQDITGDSEREILVDPLANAVFYPGQREVNGQMENDLDGTLGFIAAGWQHPPRWSMLLLDMHFATGPLLPDGRVPGRERDRQPDHLFGMQILEALYRRGEMFRKLPIIIVSANVELREQIVSRYAEWGAFSFEDKQDLTREKLQELLYHHGLIPGPEGLIGGSIAFLECLRDARRRARKTRGDNILVLGETGTGKELLAAYIHDCSGRSGRFVTFQADLVAENLIESKLFGHVKGAFTGADRDQEGCVEQAANGTLLIDEFGDLPESVQKKLLRLLDKNTRTVQRMGSDKEIEVDVQVVLATHKRHILDPASGFRSDLLQRIKAGQAITLPPLRERQDDLDLLIDFFLGKAAEVLKVAKHRISAEAREMLHQYAWPGNIRELAGIIEQAALQGKHLTLLAPRHFQLPAGHIIAPPPATASPRAAAPSPVNLSGLLTQLNAVQFGAALDPALKDKYNDLEAAFRQLQIRFLAAVLRDRHRHESRSDKLLPLTAAMKWLHNTSRMDATEAKRQVARLLKGADPQALEDPYLILALAIARNELHNRNPQSDSAVSAKLASEPRLQEAYREICNDRV